MLTDESRLRKKLAHESAAHAASLQLSKASQSVKHRFEHRGTMPCSVPVSTGAAKTRAASSTALASLEYSNSPKQSASVQEMPCATRHTSRLKSVVRSRGGGGGGESSVATPGAGGGPAAAASHTMPSAATLRHETSSATMTLLPSEAMCTRMHWRFNAGTTSRLPSASTQCVSTLSSRPRGE